jgi:hypothetical protein
MSGGAGRCGASVCVLLWCPSVLPVLVVLIVLLVSVGENRPSCGREGKGDLGRNRNGWKDNIEIDSKQIGWDGAH